ncbi:MAG: hypothetical protein GY768_04530 [Planctomycetaceae bacterium]|nr:hypothetical protein [Planctomycetaceae bacterium]
MLNGENKAHTATANRIAQVFGASYNPGKGHDIQIDDVVIEVETTATVESGIDQLAGTPGRTYVALTNKDGVREALRLVEGTKVGVMDPQGNIVKESSGEPHHQSQE